MMFILNAFLANSSLVVNAQKIILEQILEKEKPSIGYNNEIAEEVESFKYLGLDKTSKHENGH